MITYIEQGKIKENHNETNNSQHVSYTGMPKIKSCIIIGNLTFVLNLQIYKYF